MIDKKIKILHVLVSNSYSGAENVVCQIMAMFKDNSNIEMIYCSTDGEIRKALNDRKITYTLMSEPTVKEVKRVIKEIKPDIIHAHDMRASFLVSLATRKIPFISHVHNNNFNSRGINLKSILYLYAAVKAKHIFWVSKSSFKGYCFSKFLKKKSTILYNVISIDDVEKKAELSIEKNGYDVIYLGRLTEQKDPNRLLDVLKMIIDKKPDIRIGIIGTGDMEEIVRSRIKDENLSNNITYLGFMSNPYGLLKNSKVMIMTSLWEGTPMCALEAMSLGVPIVSTPTDGLKEIVEIGETGYLSDNDDDLVTSILEIITNEDKLIYMKENCYKRSEIINNLLSYKENVLKEYQRWYK